MGFCDISQVQETLLADRCRLDKLVLASAGAQSISCQITVGRNTQRKMDKISGVSKQAELEAMAHFHPGKGLRDAESAAVQVVLSMHGNMPLSALSPNPAMGG